MERIKKDLMDYKWAMFLFALYYIAVKWSFGGFCPSVILTGLPCPACGITRAFLYLIQGDIGRSVFINPTLILWILLIGYLGFFRYVLDKPAPYGKWIIGMVLVAVIGIYIYRMYCYFPNRVPMTYNRGNILEKVIPGYEDFVKKIF